MDVFPLPLPLPYSSANLGGSSDAASGTRYHASKEQMLPHHPTVLANVENRSLTSLPSSFQGMLRTSTETGDIGMFSIKPSRIPQALGTPRSNGVAYIQSSERPRQISLSPALPMDDRRRLPSYAKEMARGGMTGNPRAILSIGNLNQPLPYVRSYSLTHSSLPDHVIHNARSFSSLRSQAYQSNSTPLQRPRSPFAYPTRLRRHGFRPSSPALTDSGSADYSRRAEIERIPIGASRDATSPGSYQTYQRYPVGQSYLRSDANSITPSLSSRISPSKYTSMPNMDRKVTLTPGRDAQHIPVEGSPARRMGSRTPSAIKRIVLLPAIVTVSSVPANIHPPSPLYYDYTEGFDDQEKSRAGVRVSTPTLRLHGALAEEGKFTSTSSIVADSSDDAILPVGEACSDRCTPTLSRMNTGDSRLSSVEENARLPGSYPESIRSIVTDSAPDLKTLDCRRETKVVTLPDSGHNARELSTHVEETLRLSPCPSFEVPPKTSIESVKDADATRVASTENVHSAAVRTCSTSIHSSLHSLGTELGWFPNPPSAGTGVLEGCDDRYNGQGRLLLRCVTGVMADSRDTSMSDQYQALGRAGTMISQKTAEEPHHCAVFPSALAIIGNGDHEEGCRFEPPREELEDGLLQSTTSYKSSDSLSLIFKSRSGDRLVIPPRSASLNHYQSEKTTFKEVTIKQAGAATTSQTVPRIFAPKPVSPARQLHLKDSVPKLMKALPPLPLEQCGIRGESLYRSQIVETSHPKIPSTANSAQIRAFARLSQTLQHHQNGIQQLSGSLRQAEGVNDNETLYDNPVAMSQAQEIRPVTAPQRLKLKTRGSSYRPLSSTDSRPWNSEESDPWIAETLVMRESVDSQLSDVNMPVPQLPRFQLKVTRASDSDQGTMVVTREPAESRAQPQLHFGCNTLFSPMSGFGTMYQQANRQDHYEGEDTIHNIGDHLSSNTGLDTSSPTSGVKTRSKNRFEDVQKSSWKQAGPLSTPRAQSSFSDDSSHMAGRSRLRKRLSNLKARIPFQYMVKSEPGSSDNVSWRLVSSDGLRAYDDQVSPRNHKLRATSSTNLAIDENTRAGGLRVRIRSWLKDATVAIRSRVRRATLPAMEGNSGD